MQRPGFASYSDESRPAFVPQPDLTTPSSLSDDLTPNGNAGPSQTGASAPSCSCSCVPSEVVTMAPRRSAATALAAIAAAVLATSVSDAAVVNSITPPRGSLAGGTLVTIWGSGFNRDGMEGSTRAYVPPPAACLHRFVRR